MNVTLSVPSKTFLLGEYVALVGGPCLVAATEKRFELNVQLRGRGRLQGVHELSPAGQYYNKHKYAFLDVDIDFADPYQGAGGLGASSAQFILVYALKAFIENGFDKALPELEPETVWHEFRALHPDSKGWSPSGMDVVAQWIGGLANVQWEPFRIEPLAWPFENLSFLIFKTPFKVSTHEHLAELRQFDVEALQEVSSQTIAAIKDNDPLQFIKGMQEYERLLKEGKFVCLETFKLLENFKRMKNVLAVKGCGALGADTIAIVAEKDQVEALKGLCKVVGLDLVATDRQLSAGLQVQFEYKFSKKELYNIGHNPYNQVDL